MIRFGAISIGDVFIRSVKSGEPDSSHVAGTLLLCVEVLDSATKEPEGSRTAALVRPAVFRNRRLDSDSAIIEPPCLRYLGAEQALRQEINYRRQLR